MRDTIEMALKAGFMRITEPEDGQSDWWECFDEEIKAFEALVRADEREACAELMERQHIWVTNVAAANTIRARGENE